MQNRRNENNTKTRQSLNLAANYHTSVQAAVIAKAKKDGARSPVQRLDRDHVVQWQECWEIQGVLRSQLYED
jgi:hypothetical protein